MACVGADTASTQLRECLQQQDVSIHKPHRVTELLKDLKGLRAVAIEVELANSWLRPRVQAILASLPDPSEMLQLMQVHGWDGPTQTFVQLGPIDLVRLISQLQRWLYLRLQQVKRD